ncbi:MAG: L-threonylcarbamoyladenylate synthase [bacterium]
MTHLVEDPAAVARALLAGRLAILPTETVYGLAARADDPVAIARLYAAKGRPVDHPVIVHAHDAAVLDPAAGWVRDAPAYARDLAAAYWPGPMTLVLARGPRAGDDVTGGQDTVAVRVPAHPGARAALAGMDGQDPARAPHGVAAPSANRFGRVSPTTVRHALDELDGVLDADDVALDGGECCVGLESALVDCKGGPPRILRPGALTAADGVGPTA